MVRELVCVIARPPSVVFESSWELKEIPEDLKASVLIKGKKGDPGNYHVVRLTMIP